MFLAALICFIDCQFYVSLSYLLSRTLSLSLGLSHYPVIARTFWQFTLSYDAEDIHFFDVFTLKTNQNQNKIKQKISFLFVLFFYIVSNYFHYIFQILWLIRGCGRSRRRRIAMRTKRILANYTKKVQWKNEAAFIDFFVSCFFVL